MKETEEIRRDFPRLMESLKESIKLFRLWTESNYEDDTPVFHTIYNSKKIKNGKSNSDFLTDFLCQCIVHDIETLEEVIKRRKDEVE